MEEQDSVSIKVQDHTEPVVITQPGPLGESLQTASSTTKIQHVVSPSTENDLYSYIPIVNRWSARMLVCLNSAPGLGTMFSSLCFLFCGARTQRPDINVGKAIFVNLCVGITQMLTVWILCLGCWWSLVWSHGIILASNKGRKEMKQTLNHQRTIYIPATVLTQATVPTTIQSV